MASKKNLSLDAYEKQIAGLQPYIKYDRPTAKSPVRLYLDQDEKLAELADKQGKNKAEVVREAVDFFLKTFSESSPQETSTAA